jgi:hypothetical protein
VAHFQKALSEVFDREDDGEVGMRTDMSQAALEFQKKGSKLLDDGAGVAEDKRFLTEIEAGRWHMGMQEFNQRGPLVEIVKQLLQSNELQFYQDHCFMKESGSGLRTAFHQDAPYFPFSGSQCAVCWVPATIVREEDGRMGYVRGSHIRKIEYQPNNLVTQTPTHVMQEDEVPPMPDIEGSESEYDVVYYDADPGDVIIHSMYTMHGATGNTGASGRRRMAASIRYLGDDIRYYPKPSNMPITALNGWKPTKDLTDTRDISQLVHDSLEVGGKMNASKLAQLMWPRVWPREAASSAGRRCRL